MTELRHRLATRDDLAALTALMDAAIGELQKPFLSEAEIASSRMIMGLDTQLIDDGTYFVVEQDGVLAGCGGWSRRATLYGGDRSPGRDAALLDPATDAARVRAMYTAPGLRPPRRRPADPVAVRAGRGRRRICPRRADGHDGRRAALPRLRLPTGRSGHGRPRRRGGAVAADEQGLGGRRAGRRPMQERPASTVGSLAGCPNLRGSRISRSP